MEYLITKDTIYERMCERVRSGELEADKQRVLERVLKENSYEEIIDDIALRADFYDSDEVASAMIKMEDDIIALIYQDLAKMYGAEEKAADND